MVVGGEVSRLITGGRGASRVGWGYGERAAGAAPTPAALSLPVHSPTLQMKAFVPYMARKYDFDYE